MNTLAQDEICAMGAVELVCKMKSKALSPVEVVQAFAQRTEALEPHLHSFSLLTFDRALEQAVEAERAIAAGEAQGVLAGLPVGVKDLLHVKGVATSFGSVALKGGVALTDDPVVERIHAAGAICLGKTHAPEFGFSSVGHSPAFPTTTNPWNIELTPGGSSSGSGSAVAAGQCPVALGTDRAGSIRIPSAHCGIFGFKPSLGRVPVDALSGAMSQIGPMTRTVADAALMMSAMAGYDPRDRLSLPDSGIDWMSEISRDVSGLRIGYSRDWGYAPVSPEVTALVDTAVAVFERELGCTIEPFDAPWEDPWNAFLTLCTFGLDLRQLRGLVDRHGARMSPHLVDAVRQRMTDEDFTEAERVRRHVWDGMVALTRRYDLLLTPTVAVPPFPLLMQGPEQIAGRTVRPMEWIPFTFPVNMCGMPAASVPAGWTARNLPVGMQIIGARLDDALVLRASASFERAVPWKHRWPAIAQGPR